MLFCRTAARNSYDEALEAMRQRAGIFPPLQGTSAGGLAVVDN
jgi:hypothetical protein